MDLSVAIAGENIGKNCYLHALLVNFLEETQLKRKRGTMNKDREWKVKCLSSPLLSSSKEGFNWQMELLAPQNKSMSVFSLNALYPIYVCVHVTRVPDVSLYPMQSLPDGHVPGMRMDRGVSMPNMLEPKASADIIHFRSR